MAKTRLLRAVQVLFLFAIISIILLNPSYTGDPRVVHAAPVVEQLFASSETRSNCDGGTAGAGGSIDGAVNAAVDSCTDTVSAATEMWSFSSFGTTSAVSFTTLDLVVVMGADGFANGGGADTLTVEIWINSSTTWQTLTPNIADNNGALATNTYDVSTYLTTKADVDATQMRIYQVEPRPNASSADTITIDIDAVYLDIVGDDVALNNAPTDITLSSTAILENQPIATVIGTLTSTDADVADTHTYTLENTGACAGLGPDNASFQIGGVGGDELQSTEIFDTETKNSYTICIRTDDGNGGTFDKQFTITITNIAEAPTDITLSASTIAENQPVATLIGTLTTTDEDLGETYTYTLVNGACSGPDIASFQIGGVSGDELQSNAIFNFESASSYTICIRTDDGNGNSFDKQFVITVTNVFEAPTDITLSSTAILENQPVATLVGLLTTTDQDTGETYTYTLVNGACVGPDIASFQIGGVSGDELQSNAVFDRETTSSYTICIQTDDGNGGSFEKQFVITVTDIDEPPIAVDDGGYSTPLNTTLNVPALTGVLANDSDPEGAGLNAVLDTDVPNPHSLTLNPDGSFDYTPQNGFTGPITFTYFANDGTQNSPVAATVTINVGTANNAPTDISLSSTSVAENLPAASLVGTLTTTDADVADTHTYTLENTGACTGLGPDNASFQIGGAGSDELQTTTAFDFETKNSYTICIRTDDGNGGTFDKQFTITVSDANDIPTDISLSSTSILEGQPVGTVIGGITTTDQDGADVHTYSLVNGACTGPDLASFTVDNATDELKSAEIFDEATKNSYTICLQTDDGNGGIFEKQFIITITAGGNAAPVAVNDSYSLPHDTTLNEPAVTGVLANDTDGDSDPLTVVLPIASDVSNGVLSVNADGSFSYTPTPGWTGTDSFTYYANDGTEDSATTAQVDLIVQNLNAPTAVDNSYPVAKDTTKNIAAPGILGNDFDTDGDSFTLVLPVVTDVSNGVLTLNANGSFSYDPDPGYTGTDFFEYRINDGVQDSPVARVDLIVSNTPPVANNDGPYNIFQDNSLSVSASGVLGNDNDPNGDSLTAVLDVGPSNATSFTFNPDGSFSYSPNPGWTGVETFTYFSNDGTNDSTSPATVTINVLVNTSPNVNITAPSNGSSFSQGANVNFSGNANDGEDGDLSSSISWSSNLDGSIGTGSSVSDSTLSPGTHIITAMVSDAGGLTGSDSINITIDADPVITINEPVDGFFFSSGSTITFDGVVSDFEDDDVTLTASLTWSSDLQVPAQIGTGGLFTRSDLINGTHTITVSVTDSFSNTTNKSFQITLSALPPSPHGTYSASTDDCARCHRTHTAGTINLLNHTASDNTFCMLCHDGSGAVNVVSTHGNNSSPNGTHNSFELECVQCHEPHGSSNEKAIRTDVIWDLGPPRQTYAVTFTVAGNWDNLCQECHTRVPGSAEFGHTGGAGHMGDPTNGCDTCHNHDPDSDPVTPDGFMNSGGGGCTGCHAATTGSLPRRQIVGTNGDFEQNTDRRSHHYVSGADDPTDDQCKVCHDVTNHEPLNRVQVYNMDTGAMIDLEDGTNDDEDYETFCLSCHDGNGVTSGAVPLPVGGSAMDPFADGNAPPSVSAGWAGSSHNTSVNVGSCILCHDNGHGSNKLNLLSFWKYVSTADDDPYNEEEEFCFSCHDGGVASTDLASMFAQAINWSNAVTGTNALTNLNDRHDVQLSAQTVGGVYSASPNAVIECTDCHDVHTATNAMKVIPDPDPTDGRVPGTSTYFPGSTFMSDWCLDCHDLSMPAGVIDRHDDDSDPGTTDFPGLFDIFTFWNGDNNKDDTHGHQNGGTGSIVADIPSPTTQGEQDGWIENIALQCLDCHALHVGDVGGSGTNRPSLFQLKYTTMYRDGSTALNSNASTGTNGGTPDSVYEYSKADVFVSDNQNGYSWCNTCHDGTQMKSGDPHCSSCHMHGSRW
jgi:predicted CXXCH cytochrome family protein